MKNRRDGAGRVRILGASSIGVLVIILIAGLWPLHVPSNEVSWLHNENGLFFGHYGSIVSSGEFRDSQLIDDTAGSLELWLEPSPTAGQKTILSFDGSTHPGEPFSIHQRKDSLRIQRNNVDDDGTPRTAWSVVDGVFRRNKPVFVTITLGKHDTSVYLDGILAETFPILGVSNRNFTGRLVLANSPTTSSSWSGRILGLAIYRSQLSPAQVARNYESWTTIQRPAPAEEESPVALYLFNEGKGSVVLNQMDSATDLTIPSKYFVLHPEVFLAPWREYKPTWSYWRNVGVNIGGFAPLGFCFAAYFSSLRKIVRPGVTAVVVGLLASLTIETLQIFLPTRSSGVTDLITNTLGTAIGVMLYRCSFMQNLLARLNPVS